MSTEKSSLQNERFAFLIRPSPILQREVTVPCASARTQPAWDPSPIPTPSTQNPPNPSGSVRSGPGEVFVQKTVRFNHIQSQTFEYLKVRDVSVLYSGFVLMTPAMVLQHVVTSPDPKALGG